MGRDGLTKDHFKIVPSPGHKEQIVP